MTNLIKPKSALILKRRGRGEWGIGTLTFAISLLSLPQPQPLSNNYNNKNNNNKKRKQRLPFWGEELPGGIKIWSWVWQGKVIGRKSLHIFLLWMLFLGGKENAITRKQPTQSLKQLCMQKKKITKRDREQQHSGGNERI